MNMRRQLHENAVVFCHVVFCLEYADFQLCVQHPVIQSVILFTRFIDTWLRCGKGSFGLRKSLFRLMKQPFWHIRIAFPVSRNKPWSVCDTTFRIYYRSFSIVAVCLMGFAVCSPLVFWICFIEKYCQYFLLSEVHEYTVNPGSVIRLPPLFRAAVSRILFSITEDVEGYTGENLSARWRQQCGRRMKSWQ